MYPEVSSTLCNIPPLSLVTQPPVVHNTYSRIQEFLGSVALNSDKQFDFGYSIICSSTLFVDALRSQLSISLARGTTDAVIGNILSILQCPSELRIDLKDTLQFLKQFIREDSVQQSILCRGDNQYGQLFDHGEDENHFVNHAVKPNQRVVQVAAGPAFNAVLTQDGVVYVSGCNIEGRCGMPACSDVIYRKKLVVTMNVTELSCSTNSRTVMLIDKNGFLYSYGANDQQQLGWVCPASYSSEPGRVVLPEQCRAVHVACGAGHAVLVDALGYVLTWGSNTFKQCGYDYNSITGEGLVVKFPVPLACMSEVTAVAAGDTHTLMLTKSGQLWVCGNNHSGQLGLPFSIESSLPVHIDLPFRVVGITAGAECSLVLSEEGEVWMSGSLTEDFTFFTFTKIVSSETTGRVSRIVAGGHSIVFVTATNRVYVLGDNTQLQFPTNAKTISEPLLVPTSNLLVQDVSIAEDHLIFLCARKSPSDLQPVVSELTDQERMILDNWDSSSCMCEVQDPAQMTPEDAANVLLGFLSYSNQYYFTQQYQYKHSASKAPCDFSQCFHLNVTDTSLRNTLAIVNLLRKKYLEHYQQAKEADDARRKEEQEMARAAQAAKERAEKIAMEAARKEDTEAAKTVKERAESSEYSETRRKLQETTRKLDQLLASSRSLLRGPPSDNLLNGPPSNNALNGPPSSVLNGSPNSRVLNAPPSSMLNGPSSGNMRQSSSQSLLGTGSIHASNRSLNGTSNRSLLGSGIRNSLPSPPTNTPILKQSEAREPAVVDMEPEGAAGDEFVDLDIDLGELDSVVLTNSSPALVPTKHTLHRRRAIEEGLEDTTICRLLYEAIQLLHAQLVYVSNTNRLAIASLLIKVDSPVPLLNELMAILGIDSCSVVMSLVKKETVETLATLSHFCDSLPALAHLFQEVLSHYQAAKLEESADSHALLDVAFGLLQGLEQQGLWERLLTQGDLLQGSISLTTILSNIFQGIQGEFGSYTKRLTSDHHQVNASGLTQGVNTILRVLLMLYNEAYSSTIKGDVTAFTRLTGLVTAIVQLCRPLLSFCLSMLEQTTDTILWENNLSSEVANFLYSSPVRQSLQYAMFVLYSLIHRPYDSSPVMMLAGIDLDKVYSHVLTEVRGLLRVMSSLVISLDKCMCFLEDRNELTAKQTLIWMRDSCATTTAFATAVTSLLIRQKPTDAAVVEIEPETAKWLNSPLLSRGLSRELQDPVRIKCLGLLSGDESYEGWYEQITKTKKLNKLQQRFLNADPAVATILRYVVAACMWHCPNCYKQISEGEDSGSAVKGAYTLALQFLQAVNQSHQKGNVHYEDLEKAYLQRCRFLLDVQPMWFAPSLKELPGALGEAYQLLKNEKELEEDEDEEEEVSDAVSDVLLTMVKKFLMDGPKTEQLIHSMSARSSVAENRALSFEYFATLLSRVNNSTIRGDLTESVTNILEVQDSDTGCRKTHFIAGLEGSSPVYLERVSKAFASIIHSAMRKVDDEKSTDQVRVDVIYSIALPYAPSDAAMLQQSGLLESLTQLWSFQYLFDSSRVTPTPQPADGPVLYTSGVCYADSTNSLRSRDLTTDRRWDLTNVGDHIVKAVLTYSSAYALLESGQIMEMRPNQNPSAFYASTQHTLRTIIASPAGDSLFVLTSAGQVLSTGDNKQYQCGRAGQCHDMSLMMGAISGYRVTSVACGRSHTLLLTDSGSVLACGSNAEGQLGIASSQLKLTEVLPALEGKGVQFVAAGDDFSLFASRRQLWVCGNNSRGQLGLDPKAFPSVTTLTEVTLPPQIVHEQIASVFAGSEHSAILTVEGSLFLCGANDKGQLGDGSLTDRFTWERLLNVSVQAVALGARSTLIWDGSRVLACGANDHGQLGFVSTIPTVYPRTTLFTSHFSVTSLMVGSSSSLVVLKPAVGRSRSVITESSLKVRYAAWMLASLLFNSTCSEQLELSLFSYQFLKLLLRELYSVSQFVGDRCVSDEWDGVSPRSMREGSVGLIRHMLWTLEKNMDDSEAPPFTYMNQIITLLLVGARRSDGLINALADFTSLSVLLPIFVQIINLLEMIATSSSCQYLYLDNMPYTTPLLLILQNLISLLILILPRSQPATVTLILHQFVDPATLELLTAGIPRQTENYELPSILLRSMGRIIVIPYGPSRTLIPAPYFCRLVASKCVDLTWSLLSVSNWSTAFSALVFVCLGMTVDVALIIQQLLHQPIEPASLDKLYVLAGCTAVYAGFPAVPAVDSPIAVTVGTLRQEGRVLMFRDRRREYAWEGACIIKLSGSKELAWVRDMREMTLLTNRVPIDSYQLLGRAFDSFEHLLNPNELNRHVRNSSIFCKLQQLAMHAVMQLLQYPQAIPHVSLSVIRSVVSFLHLSLPVQYTGTAVDVLKERSDLVEGMWKLQAWESIRGSLAVSEKIDYNVNVWPPALPVGMRRCNVCKFPNKTDTPTCVLCGANRTATLGDLVQAAKTRADTMRSIRGSMASQKSRSPLDAEEEEEASIGVARKWMFFESVSEPSDAKCEVVGSRVWRELNMMKTQKQILRLGNGNYLKLSQPFLCTGEGVYVNTWSVVMDVIITDFASREYTCLLQTDATNTHPGAFYVRKDGSCGIGVYSKPGIIRNNCFHRIILSVDTPKHVLYWYVDGKKQGELSTATMPTAQILVDDRWSLDSTFLVGTDCDPGCVGSVFISSLQLRRKVVQDAEARQIGTVTLDGPPEPSNEDVILNLMNDLHVPYSWCVMALNNVEGQSESAARRWIRENESNINQILLTEARGLEKLGYDSKRCKQLILLYGNREKALEYLESNIADTKEQNMKEELTKYVAELEALELSMKESDLARHPGKLENNTWTCCLQKGASAPPCTKGDGRAVGMIAVNARVHRGPHWKWGSQDGNGFGTVTAIGNWDTHLSKGVVVHWDVGNEGKYRWNVNGCFDLMIVGEVKPGRTASVASVYGNDSATDNPAYEIVDDIKTKFKSVQTKRRTQFPDITDSTLPEIQQELSVTARALASAFSRLALLNVLAQSTKEEKGKDKLSVTSLFMDTKDNLFESFLSAFIRISESHAEDSGPLAILRREVSSVMQSEVSKVDSIITSGQDAKEITKQRFLFWLKSFSRRVLDTMLYEVSLLSQPILSEARKTLPLLQTTEYELIARYPERGVSFWLPKALKGSPLATVMKVGEGATLSLPPNTPTYVFNRQQFENKEFDCFAHPTRYDQIKVFTSASGDQFTLWRMVPPIDFAAYGMVVGKGTQPPALSEYICIRRSLLTLGQAQSVEKANEVLPTPDTFWTSASIISHFYVSSSSQPPDSNLVFTLVGEGDEQSSGSLQQVGWMLETFSMIRDDPSQSMGGLTPFIFKPELLQGLMANFFNASSEQRVILLDHVNTVLRRMRTNAVTQPVMDLLLDITQCADTLYEQQKDNNVYSPSFQAILEVLISASLMCYDSRKEGMISETDAVMTVLSRKPYFRKLSSVAVVMEALVNRERRVLPLELIMEDFMLRILVRLRRSQLFQSEHPYNDMLHRQQVVCPNATKVTLRFDRECCSAEDDVFAVFPSVESRNPILLVSGNQYSQITTRAATSQFYLEFPFFQASKLSWIRDCPVLAYNEDATIIGYRSQGVWWTVTTDKCVSSGIVSFSFCIRKLSRSNLFIGLSGVSMSKQGFLGQDSISWGLQANGSIWFNRRKQSLCSPLHENDLVKLTVNFAAHTLSVTVNGQFYGVAFRNLPSKQILMPGVSFFDAGDMVELVSCKLCATEYTRAPLDIEYVSSESTKEESVQWLKRVPEKRLRLAREMSRMGFDIHVCVLALEATMDDMQVAADYVLANMNELNRQTAHLIDSQNKAASEQQKEERMNWFMNAFLEDEKQLSSRHLPWTCPYCSSRNDYTQRNCSVCNNRKPDLGTKCVD